MRLDGRVTLASGQWGRPARAPGVAVRVEVVSAEKQDAPRKIADSSGPSERLPLCLLRVDGYREPEAAEAAHEPVGRRRRFLAVEGVGAALVVGRAAGDDVVGDRLAAAISRISAIVSAVTRGGGAARVVISVARRGETLPMPAEHGLRLDDQQRLPRGRLTLRRRIGSCWRRKVFSAIRAGRLRTRSASAPATTAGSAGSVAAARHCRSARARVRPRWVSWRNRRVSSGEILIGYG